MVESAAAVKQLVKLVPRSFARVWAAFPEAKEATIQVAGTAERRDQAKAQYTALATFISETVDNLHTQSPWLLIPPPPKVNNNPRNKGGKINAFTGNKEKVNERKGEDKPTDMEKLKAKQAEYGP